MKALRLLVDKSAVSKGGNEANIAKVWPFGDPVPQFVSLEHLERKASGYRTYTPPHHL